jgi:acyl-ACP thioesterase
MEVTTSPPAFLPQPGQGRVFSTSQLVRSTDVNPEGRLRLDALARFLQAAAEDDLADAGYSQPQEWLVRRCALAIRGYPRLGERLSVRTFCSGTGPRWAERTTTLSGSGGDLIQARAVWAAVARGDGRPVPLGAEFFRVYGPSAEGRRASVRLSHPGPPEAATGRPWPLRAADFDTADHMNNAIHWAAVEDALADLDWLPASAELEYRHAVLAGHEPRLLTVGTADQLGVWLMDGTRQLASARLAPSVGEITPGCYRPGAPRP